MSRGSLQDIFLFEGERGKAILCQHIILALEVMPIQIRKNDTIGRILIGNTVIKLSPYADDTNFFTHALIEDYSKT